MSLPRGFVVVDAYAALLTTLGFAVSLHVGGVGEDPLPEDKWGNHVVLLVHGLLDQTNGMQQNLRWTIIKT